MADRDAQLERLLNLTIALKDAHEVGRHYLEASWIREHVPGYQDKTKAAFEKQFLRDRDTLSLIGVPIRKTSRGYCLEEDQYELPAVQFTQEEATVLALAGEMGLSSELAAFARSGWTKLAASGASRDFSARPTFTSYGDLARMAPGGLQQILKACDRGERLTFDYRRSRTADPEPRRLDPWGLVTLRERIYLVGYDVDRDAPRTFRLPRVSSIRRSGPGSHPAPTGTDLQGIVEDALRQGNSLVDATLRVNPGTAQELCSRGTLDELGNLRLQGVDTQWLARTAAGYGAAVEVLDPPEARQAVIDLLKEALGDQEA